jgi:DNA primase
VLRNPEEWRRIVADAKPIIYHVLDMLVRERDISDPKVKSDIAARILPLVGDVPNPVERDAYRQQVARVLQVDESALGVLIAKKPRTRRRRALDEQAITQRERPAAIMADSQQKLYLLEWEVLHYLARDPEQLYRINRCMQSNKLERLAADDFLLTEHQQMAAIIYKALNQDELEPVHFVAENLPDGMEGILEEKPQPPAPEPSPSLGDREKRALEEVVRQVMHIRQMTIHSRINQLRFLQENQESGEENEDPDAYQARQMDLIRARNLLDKALAKPLQVD